MILKNIKKEKVGIIVLGAVVIILFIVTRIDWLGYKDVDAARNKCMMAYFNLKQVVFDHTADDYEASEFIEDICSRKEGKVNVPPDGIWIWQARFWKSEDGKWFWQDYRRQRTINLTLAKRLTDVSHLIEAKTASIMQEGIKEEKLKHDKWEAILADIKAAAISK